MRTIFRTGLIPALGTVLALAITVGCSSGSPPVSPTAGSSNTATATAGTETPIVPENGGTPAAGSPTPGPARNTPVSYLQQCGPDGVIIAWQSPTRSSSSVTIIGPNGFQKQVDDPRETTDHAIRVSRLQSDTRYSYEAKAGGVVEATGSFRTAPAQGSGTFSFAVLGDSGTGSSEQSAVARALEQGSHDVILHVGDIIYSRGEAELYRPNFFEPYQDVLPDSCFVPVAGDHDLIEAGGLAFFDVFHTPANNPVGSELYYSLDYGPVHFVMLDTTPFERGGENNEVAISEMLAWLEADLAATGQQWKVAILHHPPYSSGSKHGSYLDIRQAVSPLFERHGVAMAFSGDDHHYERSYPVLEHEQEGRGTTYVVTGGGGANTRPTGRSEFTAFSAQKYHLVQVLASPQALQVKAIDMHGVMFDEFEITAGNDSSPKYTGDGSPATKSRLFVCASDLVSLSDCDYIADGTDDQIEINQAFAACPPAGCTVVLSPGVFNTRGRESEDSIRPISNSRLEFMEGSVIRFTGVEEISDRYVIDIDGELTSANNVYVGGPGRIEVTLEADHGLRVKGESTGVVIGDGLVFNHLNPAISEDEAIQITGSVDIRNLTIRDVSISNFGRNQNGAHGIEVVGFVRDSVIERLTSVGNRRALTLRGITDPANHVLFQRGTRRPVKADAVTDKDSTTTESAQVRPNEAILVGSNGRFMGLYFDLTIGNIEAAELSIEVSDGLGGWIPVRLDRDLTALAENPLAQSGYVEFLPSAETAWLRDKYGGDVHFWVRITSTEPLSLLSISEVGVVQVPIDNRVLASTSSNEISEAFWVRSGNRNLLDGLTVENPGRSGIRLEANRDAPDPWGNVVVNTTITGAADAGVLLVNAPDSSISGTLIAGNRTGVEQNGRRSTGMTITDTVIEANSQNGVIVNSDGAQLDAVRILGNGHDSAAEPHERAGVYVNRSGDHTITDSEIGRAAEGQETQTFGLYAEEGVGRIILSNTEISAHVNDQIFDPSGAVVRKG